MASHIFTKDALGGSRIIASADTFEISSNVKLSDTAKAYFDTGDAVDLNILRDLPKIQQNVEAIAANVGDISANATILSELTSALGFSGTDVAVTGQLDTASLFASGDVALAFGPATDSSPPASVFIGGPWAEVGTGAATEANLSTQIAVSESDAVLAVAGPAIFTDELRDLSGNAVTVAELKAAADAVISGNIQLGNVDVSGNLEITGDLVVHGTTTTINSQQIELNDPTLRFKHDGSDVPPYGLEVEDMHGEVIHSLKVESGKLLLNGDDVQSRLNSDIVIYDTSDNAVAMQSVQKFILAEASPPSSQTVKMGGITSAKLLVTARGSVASYGQCSELLLFNDGTDVTLSLIGAQTNAGTAALAIAADISGTDVLVTYTAKPLAGDVNVRVMTTTMTLADDSTRPAAPTGLSVTRDISETPSITLTWTNSTSLDVVKHEASLDGTTYTDASNESITFTNIDNATTYTIYVRAVDAKGNTTTAQIVSAGDSTKPDAPTITSFKQAGTNLTVVWDASTSSDLASYKIQIDEIDPNETQATTTVVDEAVAADITPRTYTYNSITAGYVYLTQIKAVDHAGNESAVTENVNTAQLTTLAAPTFNTYTYDDASDTLDISGVEFDAVNTTDIKILYSTDFGATYTEVMKTADASLTAETIVGLTTFKLVAVGPNAVSPESDPVAVALAAPEFDIASGPDSITLSNITYDSNTVWLTATVTSEIGDAITVVTYTNDGEQTPSGAGVTYVVNELPTEIEFGTGLNLTQGTQHTVTLEAFGPGGIEADSVATVAPAPTAVSIVGTIGTSAGVGFIIEAVDVSGYDSAQAEYYIYYDTVNTMNSANLNQVDFTGVDTLVSSGSGTFFVQIIAMNTGGTVASPPDTPISVTVN